MKDISFIKVREKEMLVMDLKDTLHAEFLQDAMLREREMATLILSHLLTLQFDNDASRELNCLKDMEPIPAHDIQRRVPRRRLRIRKNIIIADFYETRLN